jgi:hypothetical protein
MDERGLDTRQHLAGCCERRFACRMPRPILIAGSVLHTALTGVNATSAIAA